MSRRALALMVAGVAAVGCSLLVPLDYTGGTPPPPHPSQGGQGGTGAVDSGGFAGEGTSGTMNEGGSFAEGGQPPEPEAGTGNSDVGGAPGTGGDTTAGSGGNAGGTTAGDGGTNGGGGTGDVGGGAMGGTDANGGMSGGGMSGGASGSMNGGMGGTLGGRGGRGGMGGMSGSSTAGNANCPDADLTSDPNNCGSCGHACADGIVCENSLCITSPCVGLTCAKAPLPMPMDDGERYKANNIGAQDVCYEVLGYVEAIAPKKPSIISWQFVAPRKLEVNGVGVTINVADPGVPLSVPERAGGYCIHAIAGDHDYAGVKLPYPGQIQ